MSHGRLYAMIWRWHLYAGLFVLPFILILAATGSVYLFKPQIDRWEERSFRNLGVENMVSPDRQLATVMAANPDARFNQYRLPRKTGDAVMVQLGLKDGTKREVYVSPEGKIMGTLNPDTRISETVSRIHGSLLIGKWGDWLVELAASWTIVMILTGLFLWWPRSFGLAGTVWPRLSLKGRPLLKDIHRVTGFWIAGFVLVMLASGLPWAGAWGNSFQWVRTELGLVGGPPQDWQIGTEGNSAHDHAAMLPGRPALPPAESLPLSYFVAKAEAEHMAFPVLITPPLAPQKFGPANGGKIWTVQSDAQNRLLRDKVSYDAATGEEVDRIVFSDQHVIDRVINTGISWHEGQLFGLWNQLLGTTVALGLVTISILGLLMWRKRRPRGGFRTPPMDEIRHGKRFHWAIGAFVVLGILLPLFGLSLVVIGLLDYIVALARKRTSRKPISG